jgi:hypothetical protein
MSSPITRLHDVAKLCTKPEWITASSTEGRKCLQFINKEPFYLIAIRRYHNSGTNTAADDVSIVFLVLLPAANAFSNVVPLILRLKQSLNKRRILICATHAQGERLCRQWLLFLVEEQWYQFRKETSVRQGLRCMGNANIKTMERRSRNGTN